MNRNVMYNYLKEIGLYPIFVHHESGKSYHVEFRTQQQHTYSIIETDWGYIRRFSSIHLCTDEIVIETQIGEMKVNINYKDIKKFEVRLLEE